MLSKRVPVPIERDLYRSLFSILEMDEGDAEEMEPAPANRACVNHLRSTVIRGSASRPSFADGGDRWTTRAGDDARTRGGCSQRWRRLPIWASGCFLARRGVCRASRAV